jgi:hypothetical protein
MKIKLYQLVNSNLQYMSVIKIQDDYINLQRVSRSHFAVVYTEKELKMAKEYYKKRNIAVVAVDYVNTCRRGKSKPKIITNASLN